jgi:hypothetical protein
MYECMLIKISLIYSLPENQSTLIHFSLNDPFTIVRLAKDPILFKEEIFSGRDFTFSEPET